MKDSTLKEHRLGTLSRAATITVMAIALLVSFVIIKPSAPKGIILLTGPEGSAYHEIGMRLADGLRSRGLEAEVRVTDGGFANIEHLAAGAPDAVAFAPSNIENVVDESVETDHLESLGSIAWEPLWIFYRAEHEITEIPELEGLKVSTGTRDTVVDFVAMKILRANDVLDGVVVVNSDDQTPASVTRSLIEGEIDAAFATGTTASPWIRELLASDGISAFSLERAAAYEARFPGSASITIPRGVVDLGNDLPSRDLILLSSTTNLVALDDLYPALVPLLLDAVAQTRDRQRFTTDPERFPNGENTSLPIALAAKRFYDHGETGLGRFLPYNVTRWINHLGFVVLPLLTVVFILLKIVPMGLKIWGGIRLMGMIKELEAVEKAHAAGVDPTELLSRLDELDRKTAAIFIPRSMVHDYIDDRQFLHDMRERVSGSADQRGV